MRRIPVVTGLVFTALAVWIGPYLVPFFGRRLYQSPVTVGRIYISCFTLAPFLLTSWILGTRRMMGRPFAETALRVATGILAGGLASPYLVLYYSVISTSYRGADARLLISFLILSSAIWLTALGLAAFELTNRIAENRTEPKVQGRRLL